MAKAFFRFLRGELNGFYIQSLNQALNEYTKDIRDFEVYFKNMQLEKGKIDDDSLYGLSSFAGVFLPRLARAISISAIRMTESHVVDNVEYSERGLLDTQEDVFRFVHTEQGELPDINTLATEDLRSSLVGDEQVIGYIAEDETDVLDGDGKVRPEKVLYSPPGNKAYSEFYGNQFLFLVEEETTYEKLEADLFIDLFKVMQYMRYNGVSLEALKRMIEVICPKGLVKINTIRVSADAKHLEITYIYDGDVEVNLKAMRLSLLKYIIQIKFPQLRFYEEGTSEE